MDGCVGWREKEGPGMAPGVCSEKLEGSSCRLLSWADWEEQLGGGVSCLDMRIEDAHWTCTWRWQVGSWTHEWPPGSGAEGQGSNWVKDEAFH